MAFQAVGWHEICCLHYDGCLTIKQERKSLLCMTVKMYTKRLPICLSGCLWMDVCGSIFYRRDTFALNVLVPVSVFLLPLSPPAKWDVNKRTSTVISKGVIIVSSTLGPVQLHHPIFRALEEAAVRIEAAPTSSASPRWWIVIRHMI